MFGRNVCLQPCNEGGVRRRAVCSGGWADKGEEGDEREEGRGVEDHELEQGSGRRRFREKGEEEADREKKAANLQDWTLFGRDFAVTRQGGEKKAHPICRTGYYPDGARGWETDGLVLGNRAKQMCFGRKQICTAVSRGTNPPRQLGVLRSQKNEKQMLVSEIQLLLRQCLQSLGS